MTSFVNRCSQYHRELGFMLAGATLATTIQYILNRPSRRRSTARPRPDDNNDKDIITTVEQLREILPAGKIGSTFDDAKKVIDHLDDQMMGFIAQSPFLQLATVDSTGSTPFVSPKGDEPGFVSIQKDWRGRGTTLIIPDRPGNRLLFGLQNILDNPKVSILFEIPGTNSTLRCGGTAHISKNLKLLEDHTARRCLPKVVLVVKIEYAFFHCAKAYMRSGLWNPQTWPANEYTVGFGRYFAPAGSGWAKSIDKDVAAHYCKIQKAIDGEGKEEESSNE